MNGKRHARGLLPWPVRFPTWDELAPARPKDTPDELPEPLHLWEGDSASSSSPGSETHDNLDGPPDSVLLPDGRIFIVSEMEEVDQLDWRSACGGVDRAGAPHRADLVLDRLPERIWCWSISQNCLG